MCVGGGGGGGGDRVIIKYIDYVDYSENSLALPQFFKLCGYLAKVLHASPMR